jgi:poly(A) polymerase
MTNNTNSTSHHIIPRDQHSLSTRHISEAALKVMSTLLKAGFDGYLVGGGVRDLLLGGHPKDFDIATDATPEQVNRLFRNARIIGRRFKIVHVRFGREVIEVTTFRGSHDTPEESRKGKRPINQQSARSQNGMLLRDNVFGTVEEDAIRRDLTINALYYTTADHAIYDYTNGLQDLDNKLIRIIGDPETRYREDPVRMLRVIRFAGKLDFSIEKNTAKPIKALANSLADIPAARMFDEVLKLFMSGHAVKTFDLMQQFGLFQPLFPQTQACLDDEFARPLIAQAMRNTDQRIQQEKPVTPAFIFAALLWPAVVRRQQQLMKEEGLPEVPALHQASTEVVSIQQQSTSIPRRFSMPMREIWDLQLRLPRRGGHKAEQMMENRRFRAAYDFLLLREESGETTGELGKWWTDYQNCSPDQRSAMSNKVSAKPARKRRKRKNSSQPDNNTAP